MNIAATASGSSSYSTSDNAKISYKKEQDSQKLKEDSAKVMEEAQEEKSEDPIEQQIQKSMTVDVTA
ncbi:MAG TPA: hypothetical protein VLM37_05890 [Fibrobacteraceae bacterium]|nr:hypothetical protein [Fibrobacteraceae bacterium]